MLDLTITLAAFAEAIFIFDDLVFIVAQLWILYNFHIIVHHVTINYIYKIYFLYMYYKM